MEIYARPANAFVARFVGSPAMTLVPVSLAPGEGMARVRLETGPEIETRVPRPPLPDSAPLSLGLRPEHVDVVGAEGAPFAGEAMLVERLGDRTFVYARLDGGPEIIAQDIGFSRVRVGDRVGLRIAAGAAHLFEPDGTAHHADAR
jgi:multiple sugar transport system ATP-binding protein